MDMIQIGLLGIAGTLTAVQFKSGKSEYAVYICAGISTAVFFSILGRISAVVDLLREITAYIELAPAYMGMLVKMLGITYVAEFSAAICKDAGYQAIAQQIEVFGKIAVLILGIPVLLSLLEMIQKFLP